MDENEKTEIKELVRETINEVNQEEKKKQRNKKLRKALIKLFIFLAIVGGILFAVNYFFPGLIWTKSLGVAYTEKDYENASLKIEEIKDIFPSEEDKEQYNYTYGELKSIRIEFTEQELTALINESIEDKNTVEKLQVKLNDDASITLSTLINLEYILETFTGGEISIYDLRAQNPAFKALPEKANLYTNMTLSIVDNNVELSLNDLSAQGIPISSFMDLTEATNTIEAEIENSLNEYQTETGATFTKIRVENNILIFEGSFPEVTKTEKN